MTTTDQIIRCPRCRRHHRLVEGAENRTLRCRGCRFAFYLADALDEDGAPFTNAAIAESPPERKSPPERASPIAEASVVPAPDSEARPSDPEPERPSASDASLVDHDYDDILSALNNPDSAPTKPPRRRLAPRKRETAMAAGQKQPTEQPPEESAAIEKPVLPVAQSVYRKRLASRRRWMIMALLFALFIGAGSAAYMYSGPTTSLSEQTIAWLKTFGLSSTTLDQLSSTNIGTDDGVEPTPADNEAFAVSLNPAFARLANREPRPRPIARIGEVAEAVPAESNTPATDDNRRPAVKRKRVKPAVKDSQPVVAAKPDRAVESRAAKIADMPPVKIVVPEMTPQVLPEHVPYLKAQSPNYRDPVSRLTFVSETKIAMARGDDTIAIANSDDADWTEQAFQTRRESPPETIAASPDGKLIVIARERGRIDVYSVDEPQPDPVLSIGLHDKTVSHLLISDDSQTCISGDAGGRITAWEMTTGKQITSYDKFKRSIQSMVARDKGRAIVATDGSQILKARLSGGSGRYTRLLRSFSGTLLSYSSGRVAIMEGNTLSVWDWSSSQKLSEMDLKRRPLDYRFNHKDDMIFVHEPDRISQWHWRSGKQVAVYEPPEGSRVTGFAISPDDRRLAIIGDRSNRHDIRIFEVQSR